MTRRFFKFTYHLFLSWVMVVTSPSLVWSQETNQAQVEETNSQRLESAQENLEENRASEGDNTHSQHIQLQSNGRTLSYYQSLSKQERDALYNESKRIIGIPTCETSYNDQVRQEQDKTIFENGLTEQGYNRSEGSFQKIEELKAKLRDLTSRMRAAAGLVEPESNRTEENNSRVDQLQSEIDELLRQAEIDERRKAVLNAELIPCFEPDGGIPSYCRSAFIEEKTTELSEINDRLIALEREVSTRERAIRGVLRQAQANSGRVRSANENANAIGRELTIVYNELIEEINKGSLRNKQILSQSLSRLETSVANSSNNLQGANIRSNADFQAWKSLQEQLDFNQNLDPSKQQTHDPNNIKRIESDLDILAMASAGLSMLQCEKVNPNPESGIDPKSHELFKAASANFLAALINERTHFSKITTECLLSCLAIDDIKRDQENGSPLYPNFKGKDLATTRSNCQTFDQRPGLFSNDRNADDDKDQQIKSIERLANLNNAIIENAELKQAHRESALLMFQDAYYAAQMEFTTKQERVAVAEAQLARAKAWKRSDDFTLIALAGALAMWSACGSFSPSCAAKAAAVAILIRWFERDRGHAEADIAEWERELQEAKMHGHLACNYPGESFTPLSASDSQIYNELDLLLIPDRITKKHSYDVVKQMMETPPTGVDQTAMYNELRENLIKARERKLELSSAGAQVNQEAEISSGIGLNQEARSYDVFLKKKLSAWRLQSFNATHLIDYTKDNFDFRVDHLTPLKQDGENSYVWNESSYDQSAQKKIVMKTGFPAPETRGIYIEAITSMILGNQDYLQDTISMSKIYANQYAELLTRTRNHLDLNTTGLEEDTNSSLSSKDSCTIINNNGQEEVDSNCLCRKNNTCERIVIRGANFSAPAMSLQRKSGRKDRVSKGLSGSVTEGSNTSGSDISSNKSALKKRENTFIKKLNSSKDSNSFSENNKSQQSNTSGHFSKDSLFSKSSSLASSQSKRSSGGSNSSLSSSLSKLQSNSFFNQRSSQDEELQRMKEGLNEHRSISFKGSKNKDSSNNRVPSSYQSKEELREKLKRRSEISFADFDKTTFTDDDEQFVYRKGVKYTVTKNKSGSKGIVLKNGKFIPLKKINKNRQYIGKFLHGADGPSIFKIISKRYRNTAYREFFNKKTK